jgi:hypothetical protein
LLALLHSLQEDQVYALAVLMYVGRGDFSADHLQHAYQAIREALPKKELAIDQLTGEMTLAEYLTDALEEIQRRRIDLDGLNFLSTVSAS